MKQMYRAIELAKQQFDEDLFVIVALISPFASIRKLARETIGNESFLEVYLNTPLSICEERDTKGLYKKARLGLIQNMTGIDSIYEAPLNPEITIDTSKETMDLSVLRILELIARDQPLSF
jgi:adenylylsulfate kinase-like enzyme